MAGLKRSVLIVENEIIVADDIARVVNNLGHRTIGPALNYTQATSFFESSLPDLVILDIQLQGKYSGLDFAHWLRTRYNTPIIYLTIFDSLKVKYQAYLQSPIAYLEKPFQEADLITSIHKCLEHH